MKFLYIASLFWGVLVYSCHVSLLSARPIQQAAIEQTVRGSVVDTDSQAPLIGVNVIIVGSQPLLGASTDENGRFAITNVPVGRVTIQVTYIGYEPKVLAEVLVTAGKELVLDVEMVESVIETEAVVVVADAPDGVAVNEMAAVSARSFSVEQTQRYAASISDPARMAQTFAGVSGGGDDLLNEIVVRGNSPRGLLWRLEGIEIPNPNHFGEEGASGGGVSMLSAATLNRSDFFTGAFPAEYGNASSGVFDLFLRNGNMSRHEYALQVGALGVDASVEGPFTRSYDGSFLINYRYSTLGILSNFGVLPEESIQFQDLSFKVALPAGKAGHFTLFGLGGDASDVYGRATPDSTAWESFDDALDGEFRPRMGVVGASHVWFMGQNTYLKTIAVAAGEHRTDEEFVLVPSQNYAGEPLFVQDTRNWAYRVSMLFNHKFSARQTLRAGVVGSYLGYDLLNQERDWINQPLNTVFDQRGDTRVLQGYLQVKYRPTAALTLTPGVHYTYFDLTGNPSIEPRLGVSWRLSSRHTLSAGAGLHTRIEPLALYFVNRPGPIGLTLQPHRNLDFMKAWHYVIGYDVEMANNIHVKLEAYYQYLQDVPVSSNADNPIFTSLNAESIWPIVFNNDTLVNGGSGRNYGVELTVEKYLTNGLYYLLTGSLYDARYTPLDGREYHSRYAGNYVVNALAGKEFAVKNRSLIGINARAIVAGGNRYTPLNVTLSEQQDAFIFDGNRIFGEQIEAYVRLDVGTSFTINRAGLTHAIRLDIQNITGRENVQGFDYNGSFERVPFFHAGLIPILSYQVSF